MSADIIQFRGAGGAAPAAAQDSLAGAADRAGAQDELAGTCSSEPRVALSAHLRESLASAAAEKSPLQPLTLRELMAIAFSSETWD